MRGLQLSEKVGLQLKECDSTVEKVYCDNSLQELDSLFNKLQSPAIIVIWQVQNIIWGKVEAGKINLHGEAEINVDHWLECRAFNQNEEIHLKRKGDKFCGRYVRDELGQGTFYVDSFAKLWGDEVNQSEENFDGYVRLLDKQRKLYMEVPCDEVGAGWYGLLTRNYIASDEKTGLSGYVDYRFVAIEPAKGGE